MVNYPCAPCYRVCKGGKRWENQWMVGRVGTVLPCLGSLESLETPLHVSQLLKVFRISRKIQTLIFKKTATGHLS